MKKIDYTEFNELIKDIINTDIYQTMKNYHHHYGVSCYTHCYNVSRSCFKKYYKKNINIKDLIYAALLHDFYLYDWHDKNKGFRWHGYKHPKIAMNNAIKYFNVNEHVQSIIYTHMFPLTIHLPKSKEAWMIVWVDKIETIKDLFRRK